MAAPQTLRFASSSADSCGAALGAGVGAVAWARAAKDDIGPASRVAANIMLRNLGMRPRAELECFMAALRRMSQAAGDRGPGAWLSHYWLQNVRVTVALTAGCWDPAAGFWPVTTAELHGMDDGTA
jgi:hypothetical protein